MPLICIAILLAWHTSQGPGDRLGTLERIIDRVSQSNAAAGYPVELNLLEVKLLSRAKAFELVLESESLDTPENAVSWLALMRALDIREDSSGNGERSAESALSGVEAFYERRTQSLVVLEESYVWKEGGRRGIEHVLAHELIHVWRDQTSGLSDLFESIGPWTDTNNVARCLMEGEAQLIGGILASEETQRLIDQAGEGLAAGERIAPFYHYGYLYAFFVYRKGGVNAVRTIWMDPPSSTEQLIHPSKLRVDFPTPVDLPAMLSGGIEEGHRDVLGQLGIQLVFDSLGVDEKTSVLAAAGWDGDLLHVLQADEQTTVAWRTVWDRDHDAQEYWSVMDSTGRGVLAIRGQVVDWVWSTNPEKQDAVMAELVLTPQEKLPDMADGESTLIVEAAWKKDHNIELSEREELALRPTVPSLPSLVSLRRSEQAAKARQDIDAIHSAVEGHAFRRDQTYPGNLQDLRDDLASDHDPLFDSWPLLDPWSHEYLYQSPKGRQKFRVYSFGADGKPGGVDEGRDIDNAPNHLVEDGHEARLRAGTAELLGSPARAVDLELEALALINDALRMLHPNDALFDEAMWARIGLVTKLSPRQCKTDVLFLLGKFPEKFNSRAVGTLAQNIAAAGAQSAGIELAKKGMLKLGAPRQEIDFVVRMISRRD